MIQEVYFMKEAFVRTHKPFVLIWYLLNVVDAVT